MTPRRSTPEDRFWAMVDRSGGPDACWIWTGCHRPAGYGRFGLLGKVRTAQRVAYEWLVGPIPPGLVLDHLCRNPPCVNPAHLEPVTDRENAARGFGNMTKTHCKRGHEFTPANIVPTRTGRTCRECSRDYHRRLYARKRAA